MVDLQKIPKAELLVRLVNLRRTAAVVPGEADRLFFQLRMREFEAELQRREALEPMAKKIPTVAVIADSRRPDGINAPSCWGTQMTEGKGCYADFVR